MTLEYIGIIIGICTGMLSLLSVVYLTAVKMTRMEVRVETMWTFLMRRALSEGLDKGICTINSPVTVAQDAKRWITDELAIPLQEFYRKCGKKLSDPDLALEIERRFGEELLKKVCIPHKLMSGACLLIAVEIAKEAA